MPKMKRHSGAAKRFRKTGRGKLIRGHAYAGHLMEGKPSQRRRRVTGTSVVSPSDASRVKKMLGG